MRPSRAVDSEMGKGSALMSIFLSAISCVLSEAESLSQGAFGRSLAVGSLFLRHPKHIQGLCGYGPASCKVCCCFDSLLLWICSQTERNSQLPGSGSKRRWYKAYLVSF